MVPNAPPAIETLLQAKPEDDRPIAIIVAGHNGSGKSTLWYKLLAERLKLPQINADRLTLALLPEPDASNKLPAWAAHMRDHDETWQRFSQHSVQHFLDLAIEHRIPFAFETVFSYLAAQPDGTFRSKVDIIEKAAKSWLLGSVAVRRSCER